MIVVGCIIAEIVATVSRKIKRKKMERTFENLEPIDEKEKSVVKRVISKHVWDHKNKERTEEDYKSKTKKELEKPSMLHRIIIKAWQKKEEKGIWSPVRIRGRKEPEKVVEIWVSGKRGDALPDKVSISLMYIPGFESYLSKELVEITDEEKRKIENWIASVILAQ